VTERLNAGISISAIAREFNTTRQTILRVKAGSVSYTHLDVYKRQVQDSDNAVVISAITG
ncbi:helix-turn-helix domain-containing protein, partial [Enterobacter hormaechei]|uniref:helix-turn-helix domain-containing protein n=1 Tax=Enterobacter hormaechei TaxID=158836 RepID=UPI001F484441